MDMEEIVAVSIGMNMPLMDVNCRLSDKRRDRHQRLPVDTRRGPSQKGQGPDG